MQLVELKTIEVIAKYIYFIITYIVFEIWLKCTAKFTDKHLWIKYNYAISAETCMPCM